jgi:hypothetical protein
MLRSVDCSYLPKFKLDIVGCYTAQIIDSYRSFRRYCRTLYSSDFSFVTDV